MDGGWVYGYYCARPDKDMYWMSVEKAVDGTHAPSIDSNTVGQFTGLKDKYGKEIYEGDILLWEAKKNRKKGRKNDEKHYWQVVWSERGQWGCKRGDAIARLFEKAFNHEVVGNQFENPDLLINK